MTDPVCPKCGSQVTQEPVCPGYQDNGRWFQCYPPCGNGALWECTEIVSCGWWFIENMNKANKLFNENEQRRPVWLGES